MCKHCRSLRSYNYYYDDDDIGDVNAHDNSYNDHDYETNDDKNDQRRCLHVVIDSSSFDERETTHTAATTSVETNDDNVAVQRQTRFVISECCTCEVMVRLLSTVGYTSVAASAIHSRQ